MSKNKENDMICTGAIPPQVIQGMEMYNAYMKAMMEFYYAWCSLAGLTYLSEIMRENLRDFEDSEKE